LVAVLNAIYEADFLGLSYGFRPGRQLLKRGALFGEMLGDDAPGRGMHARIGHLVEPLPQLLIEIIEIAEAAAEE
jgi:hypothetical protein